MQPVKEWQFNRNCHNPSTSTVHVPLDQALILLDDIVRFSSRTITDIIEEISSVVKDTLEADVDRWLSEKDGVSSSQVLSEIGRAHV